MTQPIRIQRQRTAGFRLADAAGNGLPTVYVGRPTVWGNPFVHDDRAIAVEAYGQLISGGTKTFEMGPGNLRFAPDGHHGPLHHAYPEFVTLNIHKLRGVNLACWCPLPEPGQPDHCHAAVLLELANAPAERIAS